MKWRITSISLTSGNPSIASRVKSRAQRLGGINRRNVERRKFHAALSGRGLLEDQPFVLVDVAAGLANDGRGRFGFE